MGFRTEYVLQNGNFPSMALFNEIFGGAPTSRLFMNVREKQSLCYYCSSFPDGLKGLLMVVSGIEQKNKEKTLNAVLEQLEDLKQGNVSDEELENARRSLRNGYREITDSPAAIASWYLGRISTGRYDSPEDAIAAMEQITKEDVVTVANSVRLDTVYFLEGGEQA
jgi:predicted Zn-dependent peptidase